jgi:hypothetical protein
MCETERVRIAFYRELKSERRSKKGKHRWRAFMKQVDRERVRRLIGQSDQKAQPQDRLLLIERLSENVARIMLFYEADLGNEAQARALEVLREAIEQAIRALQPSPTSVPTVVLTQLFEGVVTSVYKKAVRVQFKVEDDLEDREFRRRDLRTSQSIEEGQAVRARCQLEVLPPTKPMSPEETRKWKEQYRDVEGYHKKAKRGKRLLEGDEV